MLVSRESFYMLGVSLSLYDSVNINLYQTYYKNVKLLTNVMHQKFAPFMW